MLFTCEERSESVRDVQWEMILEIKEGLEQVALR